MTPELLRSLVIGPVLGHLNFPQLEERAVLLTAIAIQESGLKHRRQMPSGPARSWWQIEPATAKDGLFRCDDAWGLWLGLGNKIPLSVNALEYSDLGACAIAAGILRLHPGRLPEVGDRDGAWNYYLRSWRPGRPRPEAWGKAYSEAMAAHQQVLDSPLPRAAWP